MRRSTTSAATDRRRARCPARRRADLRLLFCCRAIEPAPARPAVATPRLAHHAHRSVDHRDLRRRAHGAPRRPGRSAHGTAAGPHRRPDERRRRGRHRVLGARLAARRPHRGRGIRRRVRQPRRRRPRHRGHHHRRADHVRPWRRRDERCVVANCVAPRAFPLRVARRHRGRRAALAHRGRRRFRRPPADTAACRMPQSWRKSPPTPT